MDWPAPPHLPEAACRRPGIDRLWFFPENDKEGRAKLRKAVHVCRSCPEIRACRAYALTDPTLVGVWGGTSGQTRRKLRRGERVSEIHLTEPPSQNGSSSTVALVAPGPPEAEPAATCSECGSPVRAERRTCSSACAQERQRHRRAERARTRGGRRRERPPAQPKRSGLVDLVAQLVGAGLVVRLSVDGVRLEVSGG
jgi:WhiB family transcriptional regulator, redox-sensing transcriptional regulator